ncbi:hypothetical protein GDO86_013973 [Hymenochirus boettgeri]|uniref:Otopetrin 2 n=1 Tax=Hymenochirus boettgeri TaxID=247094 RepID=A0A8T2JSF4_9PIPI|nr:hypothetical protein GDO86_013973 [Hymenochirus boettgeri]
MGDFQNPFADKAISSDSTFENVSLGELDAVLVEAPEKWKKGGRLLSGLLGINIVLLGCALISSGAFSDISVVELEVLSFLSFLMALTSCWMLLYIIWTSRHKNNMKLKDLHAGPIWLRGGLALFGVCTLVLDVMKIGKSTGLVHCESPIKIIHPVIQALFVLIQTYFLWVACKDCVQIHMNLTRCGLMLTLATNLAVWMEAVTDESLHQMGQLHTTVNQTLNTTTGVKAAGGGSGGCECKTSVCKTFETGYYYLYPFNIEYSLFASAMSYVMWKNVGRVMSQHHHHTKHTFQMGSMFVGLILGIGVLVSGLGVFIVYEIEVEPIETRSQALLMFYIFNITALSLMSVGSLAGTIIYRFDKRDLDNHKNPTRTLDVVLLLGAAIGQYGISYYSIVAMVASLPGDQLHSLILVCSLLMILQHTLQNTFIIEGLHRQPHTQHSIGTFQTNNHLSHIFSNQAAAGSQSIHPTSEDHGHQPINTSHAQKPVSGWKRKALREISLFLLLSNIIFWIISAFGARPQFVSGLEINFYGQAMWVAIVNIALPFGIFYRMHAVASLVEVYITS